MKYVVFIDDKQKEVSSTFLEKINSLNNELTKTDQIDLIFYTANFFNFASYLQTINFLRGLGVFLIVTANEVRISKSSRTNFIDTNRIIRVTRIKQNFYGLEPITNILIEEYNGL